MTGRDRIDHVVRMKQELDINEYGKDIPSKYSHLLTQRHVNIFNPSPELRN